MSVWKRRENTDELSAWQKQIIDERLSDYYKNPSDVVDFDKIIDDIELMIRG